MKPKQFKIFIAVFLAAFVIFQILLLTSNNIVSGVSSVSAAVLGASTSTLGSESSYGITYDSAGYGKLLGYYNSISMDSMTHEQKDRFIKIGTGDRTGCGPCCGIGNGPGIDSNGEIRCGCGHNLALVGLMKYLVTQHGNDFTDAQIFDEIVKWKKIFFPGQVADDGSVA